MPTRAFFFIQTTKQGNSSSAHTYADGVFQSVDDRWAAQCDDSGTTVTLAILQQRTVTVAHVGDSVAVLVKKDGSSTLL